MVSMALLHHPVLEFMGHLFLGLGILTIPFELKENNTEIIRGIRRKTLVSWLLIDLGSYNCY